MSRIRMLIKPYLFRSNRSLFQKIEPKVFGIRRLLLIRALKPMLIPNNFFDFNKNFKRNYDWRGFSKFRNFHQNIILFTSEVIKVPPFADSVSDGDVKFTCKVGDAVKADDVVMEVETDKTAVPVPAPFDGVIEEIMVKDGDTVKAGQPLFKLKKS